MNFKCSKCNSSVNKIGSAFDTGRINKYLRILPLSDELPESDTETATMIFDAFKPNNIIIMREYTLNMVNKSLRSKLKEAWRNPDELRVVKELLGSGINSKPTFNKFYASFLEKFKEQKQRLRLQNQVFIDSHFESGNIDKVYHVESINSDPQQTNLQRYKMFMSMDTNTRGHQQWFCFRVRNTNKTQHVEFTICNFTKPQSLYRRGMRLMWKSKKVQRLLKTKSNHEAWEVIPPENIIGEIKYNRSPLVRNKKPLF